MTVVTATSPLLALTDALAVRVPGASAANDAFAPVLASLLTVAMPPARTAEVATGTALPPPGSTLPLEAPRPHADPGGAVRDDAAPLDPDAAPSADPVSAVSIHIAAAPPPRDDTSAVVATAQPALVIPPIPDAPAPVPSATPAPAVIEAPGDDAPASPTVFPERRADVSAPSRPRHDPAVPRPARFAAVAPEPDATTQVAADDATQADDTTPITATDVVGDAALLPLAIVTPPPPDREPPPTPVLAGALRTDARAPLAGVRIAMPAATDQPAPIAQRAPEPRFATPPATRLATDGRPAPDPAAFILATAAPVPAPIATAPTATAPSTAGGRAPDPAPVRIGSTKARAITAAPPSADMAGASVEAPTALVAAAPPAVIVAAGSRTPSAGLSPVIAPPPTAAPVPTDPVLPAVTSLTAPLPPAPASGVAMAVSTPAAPTAREDVAATPARVPVPAAATTARPSAPAAPAAPVAPAILPALQAFGAALHRAAAAERRPVRREVEAASLAPAAATPLAPLADPPPVDTSRPRWPDAMVARIEAVRDAQATAGTAADTRIRLHPDALGSVDVAIRRDGEAVHVTIHAAEPATRALLAEAQPRLQELAETRGLRLAGTEVAGGGGQTAGQGWSEGSRRQPAAAQPPRPAVRPAPEPAASEDPTDTRIA